MSARGAESVESYLRGIQKVVHVFSTAFAAATRRLILRFLVLALLLVAAGCAPKRETESAQKAELGPPPPTSLGELSPGEPSSAIAVEADDPRLGNPDAAVTVIAFLDFQCSFCAQGFGNLMQLRKEYSDADLRIVFKHLPLEFHEMALPAAIAGQAVMQSAGSEAFFKYAHIAFTRQAELSYEKLGVFALEAGVKRKAYNELVGQEETVRRIAQDARLAAQSGVDGTPAFFVNGRLISGAQPIEYFRQVIGEELAFMQASGRDWKSTYQARVTENMRGSVLTALLAQDPEDYRVPVDGSPTSGPEDAPVTLVMFTDFECPYCKRAEVTLDLIRKKYGEKVRYVFKHMPLPFHERARPAALLAAKVQQNQGDAAFFRASSAIFRSSPDLSERTLRKIGQDQGLTEEQMDAAFRDTDAELRARLLKDQDLAEDVLARGTPHFFINGKRLSGARPVEQFEALIDHGLRRADELRKSATPPSDVYARLQEKALSPGIPERMDAEVPSAGRPSRGKLDAPITIHVFSDFECPYCKQGEKLLAELDAQFKDKLRIVWHDFPLDFHEDARPAARAAREAFAQKGDAGFWKMHERLFAFEKEKPALSIDAILEHTKALGLDATKMQKALDESVHDGAIDADIELGKSLGIRGTPAYVVDGFVVTGLKPKRHFERLIERSLSEKEK